jgi:ribose 5-phosphate isomerase B
VSGEASLGFLFCGSGVGVSIAANKVNGIRAALCYEHNTAKMAREHNDTNVMCAGARVTGIEVVKDMVQTFLATPFAGGKHANRVEKIMALQTQKHE